VSNPCCPLLSHFKYTPLCVAYYWPLCASMTSCIKLEVHSISQRRQRKTEPRLLVTCTKIWRRSELQFRMFSAGQTNRTDTIFCCLIWGGVTSDVAVSSNCCKTHPQHTRLMALCPGLPRWAGTRKVNQSGFYWSKRQWESVASAGTYASLHLAADRQPRHHPTTQFYRPDYSLPAAQATASKH